MFSQAISINGVFSDLNQLHGDYFLVFLKLALLKHRKNKKWLYCWKIYIFCLFLQGDLIIA